MYKFANELLTKLAACEHVTITERSAEEYGVRVDLGGGYKDIDWEGGYWADSVRITDDTLALEFSLFTGSMNWDEEEEFCFGEGYVWLHYADYGSGQLAYTSALENEINEQVSKRTGGILTCDGSEQGMQGYDSEDDCYLSLDVWEAE